MCVAEQMKCCIRRGSHRIRLGSHPVSMVPLQAVYSLLAASCPLAICLPLQALY